MYTFWKDMHTRFNAQGMRSVPIVMLEVTNNCTLITTQILPIFTEMVQASKHQPDYHIQVRPIYTDRPDWIVPIENRMNHVNEHIRYDTKNKFPLLALLNPAMMISMSRWITGVRSGNCSSGMFYMKMLREPVYDAIRVLGEQDFYRSVAKKLADGKKDEAQELCSDYFAGLGYTLEFSGRSVDREQQ
ncbi:hypothetical protein D9619_013161 [Psilocybe cf. subviscida]|uniref:Uncharacterized protein n=1 Tax=Psilocybe cf. subviscida TaxID=2480587 RepID=A0A8H5B6K0_9AGAR|nr:hypothetical protein D9619_013161 [Psilocybe cf. subviscida]